MMVSTLCGGAGPQRGTGNICEKIHWHGAVLHGAVYAPLLGTGNIIDLLLGYELYFMGRGRPTAGDGEFLFIIVYDGQYFMRRCRPTAGNGEHL